MSIFDLLFIAVFLGSLGYALGILWLLLRRRWIGARRHAIRWAGGVGVYLLTVVVVGISSDRHILGSGEILRYDDWCLGVKRAGFADSLGGVRPGAGMRFLVVTLEASSTAGRVQAAPNGALAYVLDEADTRYDVAEPAQLAFEKLNGAQPALTARLEPHGSFLTTQVFEVPRGATEFFLGHRHGNGSRFPGMFIIGTGFHKAAVISLEPR